MNKNQMMQKGMSCVIHSVGINEYRTVSEETKSNPNIQQLNISHTSRTAEDRKVKHKEEDKSEQESYLSEKKISQAIEEFNKKIESHNKRLEYVVHKRTNRLLIKVIDTQTDRVIKEIPDEKLMDMMADFCEASGILIDEKI